MSLEIEEIKDRLLVSCALDWVPFTVFEGEIEMSGVASSEEEKERLVLEVIEELLSRGLVDVGNLDLDAATDEFQPWTVGTREAVSRIRDHWSQRYTSDIAWFRTTLEGRRQARAVAGKLNLNIEGAL